MQRAKHDDRPRRYFWAPGDYECLCSMCGNRYIGDKRSATCAGCAYQDWMPSHRHVKTGGLYMVIYTTAFIEKTMTRAVVYQGMDGQVWVRPCSEFHDGRFVELEDFEFE